MSHIQSCTPDEHRTSFTRQLFVHRLAIEPSHLHHISLRHVSFGFVTRDLLCWFVLVRSLRELFVFFWLTNHSGDSTVDCGARRGTKLWPDKFGNASVVTIDARVGPRMGRDPPSSSQHQQTATRTFNGSKTCDFGRQRQHRRRTGQGGWLLRHLTAAEVVVDEVCPPTPSGWPRPGSPTRNVEKAPTPSRGPLGQHELPSPSSSSPEKEDGRQYHSKGGGRRPQCHTREGGWQSSTTPNEVEVESSPAHKQQANRSVETEIFNNCKNMFTQKAIFS